MAELSLRNVSKQFGTVEVIRDLSLDIPSGEFAVFLGPSGCGKSTLLRMIAGLEAVGRGEIHLGGTRIDTMAPGDRGVAMVFQHYALYPHMTVRENMAFGLRNIGTPQAEIDRKIADAAEMLEIGELLARKPTQLSGGQRQRVAIGRAIVKQPRAFLFDEPLSNLDAALRSRTRIELARLHQRVSSTMIFVTHDQVEAMTMATRIVVMNQGRIEQVGTPMEIYQRPRTRFVAGFIGAPAMNFLTIAGVTERGGMAVARLPDGSEVATVIPIAAVSSGGLTLGVRAEHVLPGGGAAAKVDVIERLGERTLVYANFADGSSVVYDEPGDVRLSVGDSVALTIDGTAAHLFGPDGFALHG
ncbi:MAG: sn-glycerol-3-phosphate ABC transporter ATP-binding protein UgpC [Alphaproteobacteria bacterium]|nr:sn-glycerol-3-phosphate ABC transporter ATP-binding protein UgpC [Alphaproteobacteria bacterium]